MSWIPTAINSKCSWYLLEQYTWRSRQDSYNNAEDQQRIKCAIEQNVLWRWVWQGNHWESEIAGVLSRPAKSHIASRQPRVVISSIATERNLALCPLDWLKLARLQMLPNYTSHRWRPLAEGSFMRVMRKVTGSFGAWRSHRPSTLAIRRLVPADSCGDSNVGNATFAVHSICCVVCVLYCAYTGLLALISKIRLASSPLCKSNHEKNSIYSFTTARTVSACFETVAISRPSIALTLFFYSFFFFNFYGIFMAALKWSEWVTIRFFTNESGKQSQW